MDRDIPGRKIDVFISGHTHAPSLSEIQRENGDAAIIVNPAAGLGNCNRSRHTSEGRLIFFEVRADACEGLP